MALKPIQLFLAMGMVATLAACGGEAPVEEDAIEDIPVEEVEPEGEEEGGEGGEGGEG
ncbi:MAG: hypothetical protein AAFY78_04445 [Cyanobacteria bacterium J06648_16]